MAQNVPKHEKMRQFFGGYWPDIGPFLSEKGHGHQRNQGNVKAEKHGLTRYHSLGTLFCYIILLFLSNSAFYWFRAIGSGTEFFRYACNKLSEWLVPRSCSFLPPKIPYLIVVVMLYGHVLLSYSLQVNLEHVKAMKHRETTRLVIRLNFFTSSFVNVG